MRKRTPGARATGVALLGKPPNEEKRFSEASLSPNNEPNQLQLMAERGGDCRGTLDAAKLELFVRYIFFKVYVLLAYWDKRERGCVSSVCSSYEHTRHTQYVPEGELLTGFDFQCM